MTPQDLMTIIGTNIALFGIFTAVIYWMINRVDADVKAIGVRMDGHTVRIDQLYQMFVDLLKERK